MQTTDNGQLTMCRRKEGTSNVLLKLFFVIFDISYTIIKTNAFPIYLKCIMFCLIVLCHVFLTQIQLID